jgi:hypothetical protein
LHLVLPGRYGSLMEEEGRWAHLDDHLPSQVRVYLEERFWRPIEAQATLEVLCDDPSFFAEPGSHPALFADHGIVHVRDVAVGLVRLLDTLNGVLLAARPAARQRFLTTYGVAAVYLHDIGMVDMSPVGRRIHALVAAHAAFDPEVDPLVEHLLAAGPVRARLDEVAARAPFSVPLDIVVREMLSLAAAHSKSTVPAPVLDDRASLRRLMQRILFTTLDDHRRAIRTPSADDASPVRVAVNGARYEDTSAAFAWLSAGDGPQAELADDVVDTVRAMRAADVLRQRGTVLRTSGGYEICFDARTAHAICTLRPATGDAAYVITYDDPRGAGEANVKAAFLTPQGDLRIAFHVGEFPDEQVTCRAAESVGGAILDIQADVIPSFTGTPARGLPSPSKLTDDVRIQLERPGDEPAFADAVAEVLGALDPSLRPRLETVSNVEDAAPEERQRFHTAEAVHAEDAAAAEITRQLGARGVETSGLDLATAFAEVRRATIRPGEVLVANGSPPAFVYVPTGPGLLVRPGGGYAPSPLPAWVPVGTTGVIRRAERNSEIIAEREVDVIMIPGARYASSWLRPLDPEELRSRLAQRTLAG